MIWGTITTICTLLLLGFKVGIYFYKKNTKKPNYEEDKQQMENAIARGHAADITAMFDDVRRPPSGTDNLSGSGNQEAP